MSPDVVPNDSRTRTSAAGPLRHMCPHVDEVDRGTVEIAWTCAGFTIELHSLAEYLKTFGDERISHEAITRAIRDDLAALQGIADVAVSTTWNTAGLTVHVGPVTA